MNNLGQLCVFRIQFISVHLETSFNESMKTNFVINEMQYICLKKSYKLLIVILKDSGLNITLLVIFQRTARLQHSDVYDIKFRME